VGRLSELFCAVLYTTVVHSYKHTCEHFLQLTVSLVLGFLFVFLPRYILC